MTSLRISSSFVLALHSASLLAAAQPQSSSNDQSAEGVAAAVTSLTYACDGGKKIVAVRDNSDADHPKTVVSVEGDATMQNIEMHDVMSANGVKTSNGKLVWWTKGDEGFLAEEEPPAGSGEVLIGECKEVASA